MKALYTFPFELQLLVVLKDSRHWKTVSLCKTKEEAKESYEWQRKHVATRKGSIVRIVEVVLTSEMD